MDISKKSIKIKLCIMFVILIISTIIISEVYTIFSFKKVILAQTENDGLKIVKNIFLGK
ncbi:hypothetical protein ACYUJ6_03520 [Clostridium sp. JNZ X4-2]